MIHGTWDGKSVGVSVNAGIGDVTNKTGANLGVSAGVEFGGKQGPTFSLGVSGGIGGMNIGASLNFDKKGFAGFGLNAGFSGGIGGGYSMGGNIGLSFDKNGQFQSVSIGASGGYSGLSKNEFGYSYMSYNESVGFTFGKDGSVIGASAELSTSRIFVSNEEMRVLIHKYTTAEVSKATGSDGEYLRKPASQCDTLQLQEVAPVELQEVNIPDIQSQNISRPEQPNFQLISANVSGAIDSGKKSKEEIKFSKFKEKYKDTIETYAKELGVETDILAAIIYLESDGISKINNRIIIRFETTYFDANTGNVNFGINFTNDQPKGWEGQKFRISATNEWLDIHGCGQGREYQAFELAKSLNENAAYKSISMGMGQIMGSKANVLGYSTAKDMYNKFSESGLNQIKGMVEFIKKDPYLHNVLKNKDFTEVVRRYNGPGNVNEYKPKMMKYYDWYKKY